MRKRKIAIFNIANNVSEQEMSAVLNGNSIYISGIKNNNTSLNDVSKLHNFILVI